ncbi:SRPBCC domain-containing protein [Pelomonas cellulosilytica]|uniref:SRPBCC domain-containing protein n=1 Tax=Pelomonas cellulosilytica TaxID=2906762 RepID=A0ABS8XSD9_9BURK|nr:SRPBCC domain-containing protein [Pelomonas sp. P8]MCE4555619.1 SRPBCC domain-containing protein [Pelomonas sp. P8]
MKDLDFGIDIAAPRERVWDCMFDPLAYRDWTRAFAEGSYYEGVWATGRRLRFLDPQGFGMEAVVDEALPHERLSLRLIGEIKEGRPVAGSPLVKAPAHERYVFTATPRDGTHLAVHLQSWDDGFTDFLQTTWPQALQRLKTIAETPT